MDKKKLNILKYSASAALAAALLWFSFRGIEWDHFKKGLASCDWQYVLLSVLIGMYSFWIRGRRWRETLLPIDPSTSRLTTLNAVNISYIVNMIVPRGGELVRCGIVTRHSARDAGGQKLASFDKVLGTVLVDRVWDTIVMLLIFAGMFFAFRDDWGSLLKANSGGVNFSSTAVLLGIAGLLLLFGGICYFFHGKNRFLGRIWNFVKGILTGAKESLKMPSPGRFLMLTVLLWLSYWGTSATILLSLNGADLGFEGLGALDALFLMSVGSISSIIPVPGGFGAYHYIITLSLSALYGIPTETGLIFAVLSHESQAIGQILCGGASYISETVRKK